MATAAMILAEELAQVTHWDDDPPPRIEEQELDLLAFELWKQASSPDNPDAANWMTEEEALRTHASCL